MNDKKMTDNMQCCTWQGALLETVLEKLFSCDEIAKMFWN